MEMSEIRRQTLQVVSGERWIKKPASKKPTDVTPQEVSDITPARLSGEDVERISQAQIDIDTEPTTASTTAGTTLLFGRLGGKRVREEGKGEALACEFESKGFSNDEEVDKHQHNFVNMSPQT